MIESPEIEFRHSHIGCDGWTWCSVWQAVWATLVRQIEPGPWSSSDNIDGRASTSKAFALPAAATLGLAAIKLSLCGCCTLSFWKSSFFTVQTCWSFPIEGIHSPASLNVVLVTPLPSVPGFLILESSWTVGITSCYFFRWSLALPRNRNSVLLRVVDHTASTSFTRACFSSFHWVLALGCSAGFQRFSFIYRAWHVTHLLL